MTFDEYNTGHIPALMIKISITVKPRKFGLLFFKMLANST